MNRELDAHFRLLAAAYSRYLAAERRLARADTEIRTFFPANRAPRRGTIGAPRSPVRRLHDERDRALLRLHSSYEKFRMARARVEGRQSKRIETLLLTFRID
jgi:hypothetical protein